jgi:molybdopterin-guanine dinucleotide biosynthesis protein A
MPIEQGLGCRVIEFDRITLGILAGGRASRLDGADKALLHFDGESLLQRTLRAFPERYCERLLSYNRIDGVQLPPELRIVTDQRSDFPGPLAALEALGASCATPWLLTVPVDVREIPAALAADLIEAAGPDGVMLRDADGLQPLVALWRVEILALAVANAFATDQRAAHELISGMEMRFHDISPRRIGNLNTLDDFAAS